jgi:hypothetical protein
MGVRGEAEAGILSQGAGPSSPACAQAYSTSYAPRSMKIPPMPVPERSVYCSLAPLALALWLAPACGEEPCNLGLSLTHFSVQDARGNLLPQANIAVTWTGEDGHEVQFELTCGVPAEPASGDADTCSFTLNYAREPGKYGAGTLSLRIEAPGLVPLEEAYSRTMQGCDVVPDIVEALTLKDAPDVHGLCAARCAVELQCDPDAGWTAEECASTCEADLAISGGEADACRPAFAAMYACIGELSCADYSAFVAGESSPCSVAEQHVAACEAQGPTPGLAPSP